MVGHYTNQEEDTIRGIMADLRSADHNTLRLILRARGKGRPVDLLKEAAKRVLDERAERAG